MAVAELEMAVAEEMAVAVTANTQPASYDNFLPDSIADQLYKYVNDIRWTYGWKSNKSIGHAHWNFDIAGAGTHNGLDVSNRLMGPVLDAWNHIQSTYLKDYILIRCYANAHTYGVEGYPHTDSRRDQDVTVVVYMNKDWKREWGGETVIYNGNDITLASTPAFNRALIFKGNQWHCARGVTRICPDQRRTIMFKCAVANADPTRDNLQKFLHNVGANNKEHRYGNLTNHLLNTYDLLKAAGQNTTTCLAGGAHSIFGTNIFKGACLTLESREQLEAIIGKEATDLVRIFGTIDRPRVLENPAKLVNNLDLTDGGITTVTQEQFDALCAIEAANLYDQNGLDQYPNLKALWARIFKTDK
jgi:2OG-Fe(II) oxygenase superfamily